MSDDRFYEKLECFKNFQEIIDDSYYSVMPDDWKIIITDVVGSTKAIEAGAYKDVNTIGAATIVSVSKGYGSMEFPFVFGGDGATVAVPSSKVDAVLKELTALQSLSKANFGLDLRVGMVGVHQVKERGQEIYIAKYELVKGKAIAMFKGGGVSLADKMIKDEEEKYGVKSQEVKEADLSGLSCRWNPIPNKHGQVLSLLVEARGENEEEILSDLFKEMDKIFSGNVENHNPVNIDKATYKTVIECIDFEKRYHDSKISFAFVFRALEIFLAVLIFKFGFKPMVFDPKRYANSMRTHSDYRKFDDLLRMIIDCNDIQAKKLEDYLEAEYQKGHLFYGIHKSEVSLMTCYVDDLDEGNHIHFIDGGNGGYAMAAKGFKEQIKLANEAVKIKKAP